nr:MAG TPA: hypothetical protein [Caudoviricetes sp.]
MMNGRGWAFWPYSTRRTVLRQRLLLGQTVCLPYRRKLRRSRQAAEELFLPGLRKTCSALLWTCDTVPSRTLTSRETTPARRRRTWCSRFLPTRTMPSALPRRRRKPLRTPAKPLRMRPKRRARERAVRLPVQRQPRRELRTRQHPARAQRARQRRLNPLPTRLTRAQKQLRPHRTAPKMLLRQPLMQRVPLDKLLAWPHRVQRRLKLPNREQRSQQKRRLKQKRARKTPCKMLAQQKMPQVAMPMLRQKALQQQRTVRQMQRAAPAQPKKAKRRPPRAPKKPRHLPRRLRWTACTRPCWTAPTRRRSLNSGGRLP